LYLTYQDTHEECFNVLDVHNSVEQITAAHKCKNVMSFLHIVTVLSKTVIFKCCVKTCFLVERAVFGEDKGHLSSENLFG
jgi:hypothetical protein